MESVPSIRSVATAVASVAVVVTVWVSMSLTFDLIFHFHPVFLGVVAAWSLRRVDASSRGSASIAVVVVLSALGGIAGTEVIESGGGPVGPDGFTAGVTSLGIAAGIYLLNRPPAPANPDTR